MLPHLWVLSDLFTYSLSHGKADPDGRRISLIAAKYVYGVANLLSSSRSQRAAIRRLLIVEALSPPPIRYSASGGLCLRVPIGIHSGESNILHKRVCSNLCYAMVFNPLIQTLPLAPRPNPTVDQQLKPPVLRLSTQGLQQYVRLRTASDIGQVSTMLLTLVLIDAVSLASRRRLLQVGNRIQ